MAWLFSSGVWAEVDDKMEEDDPQALERWSSRVSEAPNATYGVLLVTGPLELAWSDVTVHLWRAYCQKHGYGFLALEEPLTSGLKFEWTKPRALMELVAQARWHYVMLVDASSVPVDFRRGINNVVKEHMRHKRYATDNVKDRLIFCPFDCEEEYDNMHLDGVCYGPTSSGCIFHAKKPATQRLVKAWYALRSDPQFSEDQAVMQAFNKMRDVNYQAVYFKDVQKEMGRPYSSFMASFTFDPKYGWNVRDQIHDFIGKKKELGKIVNEFRKGETAARKEEI